MRDAGERGAEERQAAGAGLRIVVQARGRGAGAPRAARGGRAPHLRPALFPQDADAAADALAAGAPRGDRFLAMVDRLRVQG